MKFLISAPNFRGSADPLIRPSRAPEHICRPIDSRLGSSRAIWKGDQMRSRPMSGYVRPMSPLHTFFMDSTDKRLDPYC